ncbi:MAG: hypothetical protein U0360_01020 [Dehalococcoidia bacterium]
MTLPRLLILLAVLVLVVAAGAGYWYLTPPAPDPAFAGTYAPTINPSEFSPNITNRFVTMVPGMKLTYESKGEEGLEVIEISVTAETRMIMGVETRKVLDRATVNSVLVEDTRDYIAQDKAGNVWYFGEEVDNYKDGKINNHNGSWIAGVDGALPGIWMLANPKVGDKYRQEYYKGQAEDVARVVSTSETLTVRGKTYKDCLKTLDTSLIETSLREEKYYCAEVGAQGLVVDPAEHVRDELVSITGRP